MTIAIKVEFLRNDSFFLYRSWVFTIEEEFQDEFSIFYTKFCVYQQAKVFIDENLVLKKEKSVAFYTKHIFTAVINNCLLFNIWLYGKFKFWTYYTIIKNDQDQFRALRTQDKKQNKSQRELA